MEEKEEGKVCRCVLVIQRNTFLNHSVFPTGVELNKCSLVVILVGSNAKIICLQLKSQSKMFLSF